MPQIDTRRLLDLIAGKHACLLRLSEHGRKQQELIESGDVTQLLGLLAVKQRTIDELHEHERNLDPYRADDPAQRVWSSDAERVRCSSLAEQSAQLLREILALENRCEESLRRRRDEAAVQLSAVQSSGAARGAYAASANASFAESTLDLTSDQ